MAGVASFRAEGEHGQRLQPGSTSSDSGSGQASGLVLSTANLYSAVQPGGSLFGLQESNPVDVSVAYKGPSSNYGTANDSMVGNKIGGVNVFGGGLALYGPGRVIVGAVGVSGDTSCADHDIAWRVRRALNLDHMAGVGGVSGDTARPDNIIYDVDGGVGAGHPRLMPRHHRPSRRGWPAACPRRRRHGRRRSPRARARSAARAPAPARSRAGRPWCRPSCGAPAAYAEGAAVRGAGRDLQRDRTTAERRDLDLGAEGQPRRTTRVRRA